MKGRAIRWSAKERAWIKARAHMPRREAYAAFRAKFKRRGVSFDNFKSLYWREGWKTGRTGRFEKGIVPHNKGKPFPARGRAIETQFKKGCRRGRANENYKPIGTERLSKDGYLERKVHDGMPLQSRWRAVHLIRWEEKNGPLPKGHCLKCLNGDKLNTNPANWTLLSRAALAILNRAWNGLSYDDAPAHLKPSILAIAKLKAASSSKHRGARV